MRIFGVAIWCVCLVGCPRSGYDRLDANNPPGCEIESEYLGRIPFSEDPSALDPATLPQTAGPCHEPVLAHVDRTIDGDTIHVTYTDPNDGQPSMVEEQVRLVGINSPEVDHGPGSPEECFGDEASLFTRQLTDRWVWLTFDRSCRDPFNRWLAYVHTTNAPGGFFNRQLMLRGFARPLTIAPNNSFQTTFADDYSRATCARQGLHVACITSGDAGTRDAR